MKPATLPELAARFAARIAERYRGHEIPAPDS